MLPYGKHSVDAADIEAVVDVLQNQFLTQGSVVPRFEQGLCDYTGAKYAVAVNSGTSGLHVACLAAGIGHGDTVWTVPNSFVASANCALYCGAQVDFVDINASTRNIDLDSLAVKLAQANKRNALPKLLIVVHFAGFSCDMQAIYNLTQEYGVMLIEDAAHGLGGSYQQQKIGSCQYSDMTVLSFHPVKSITSAEGGAVLTNSPNLYKQLVLFAKHGVTRDSELMQGQSHGPWYYQQVELGYNYRLSDIHAALGLSQLSKLDLFIAERRRIAANYFELLAELPLVLPNESELDSSAWHLFMVELLEHDRTEVFQQLRAKNIGVNVHYIPIHTQPYYQQLGFKAGDFPASEAFYQCAITLPIFPNMTNDQQMHVVNSLHEALQ